MAPVLFRAVSALVVRRASTLVRPRARGGVGATVPSWAHRTTTSAPDSAAPAPAATAAAAARGPVEQALSFFRRLLAIQAVRASVYGVGTLVAGVGVLYVWSVSSKHAMEQTMLSYFENGGAPGWEKRYPDAGADVARPAMVAELAKHLQPIEADSYVVIVGETGTGKSTAVRQAVRGLPWPKGVVYFDSPTCSQKFSTRLSAAVGFSPHVADPFGMLRRLVSGVSTEEGEPKIKEEPLATWVKLELALRNVALAYKAKHGRPLTLVIDAADRVAKKDPIFFRDLQDFAKKMADGQSMTIVFVSSEGRILPLLQSSSAFSRAEDPFEVGDIADEDAVAYLVKKGVPPERAADAVRTVTGGRIWLLSSFAQVHARETVGKFYEGFRATIRFALGELKLRADHELFRHVAAHGHISKDLAASLVGTDLLQSLLDKNVLAMHPNQTYSFNARLLEEFFREAISEADRAPAERAAQHWRWQR